MYLYGWTGKFYLSWGEDKKVLTVALAQKTQSQDVPTSSS